MQSLQPKVLMFGWEFPPHNSGGLGVACYGLTRSLAKLGAKITFVLPKNIGICSELMNIKYADTARYNLRQAIKFKELNVFLYPYITEEVFKDKKSWQKVMKELQSAPYANNIYEETLRYAAMSHDIAANEDYDIIHAHDWLSFPAGIEAKRVSGKQLVAHVHATEFDRSGGQGANPKVYEIEKCGFEKADKIVTVSNLVKRTVKDRYAIDPEKIEVIHNGIDEDYFSADKVSINRLQSLKRSGHKIVLSLGRITIQKGLDYFIEAAKKVLEHEKKVFFLFVGAGDMQEQIMHRAAELRISDKIFFAGWLKGEELTQAYQASDLFVMPSVSEPFGLTPLESMLNNTPVIVSKQSGVSEVSDNMLKVDFWDVDELANKMVAVLRHDSLYKHLQFNGREEVKKLSWIGPAQKCLNLYNNLLYNPV